MATDADVVSEADMRRFVMAYNSSIQPVALPAAPLQQGIVTTPTTPTSSTSTSTGMSRQKLAALALLGLVSAIVLATVIYLCCKRTSKPPPPT
jgi:hypothetical protein